MLFHGSGQSASFSYVHVFLCPRSSPKCEELSSDGYSNAEIFAPTVPEFLAILINIIHVPLLPGTRALRQRPLFEPFEGPTPPLSRKCGITGQFRPRMSFVRICPSDSPVMRNLLTPPVSRFQSTWMFILLEILRRADQDYAEKSLCEGGCLKRTSLFCPGL